MNVKMLTIIISIVGTMINANAQVTKAEIIATGLTCSMCSNAINKQLKALAEVDSVQVDLNTNTFTVYVKKDAKVSPRILKERVEKAGFFVGSMIVTMHFNQVELSQNANIEQEGLRLIATEKESRVLNGNVQLKILDKGYVTQKEYKKLSKSLSGRSTYQNEDENEYHVKTIGL
jgi:copper chaperone CopZ